MKILIPFDGSAHAEHALAHTLKAYPNAGEKDLLLLNVQHPIVYGEVAIYIQADKLEEMARDAATRALDVSKPLLERAGRQATRLMEIGDIAETIAAIAKRQQVDAIVMGTRGMGAIGTFVIGSVASKVVHLVDVPVTLVK